jgi:hypothetical protein
VDGWERELCVGWEVSVGSWFYSNVCKGYAYGCVVIEVVRRRVDTLVVVQGVDAVTCTL